MAVTTRLSIPNPIGTDAFNRAIVNDIVETIDAAVAGLGVANTFTGSNTFTDSILAEEALIMTQIATPSAPGSGLNAVYAKTDGRIYTRSGASGAETLVGEGGGSFWLTLYFGG